MSPTAIGLKPNTQARWLFDRRRIICSTDFNSMTSARLILSLNGLNCLNLLNYFCEAKRQKSKRDWYTNHTQIEPDQRHELMQMCKSWLASNQLPAACLERRVYEDVISPTHLLLVEQWLDTDAMNSHLSSDQFRALIGAVKVLGTLVDVRISETNIIEAWISTGGW